MKIIIECDTSEETEVAEGIRSLIEDGMRKSDWAMGYPCSVLVDAQRRQHE